MWGDAISISHSINAINAISPFIALQRAAMGNYNTFRLPCLWQGLSFERLNCSIVLQELFTPKLAENVFTLKPSKM